MSDRGEDADDRDYDQQLDQGEGALNRGRGTFGHGFCGLGAHDIALGREAKAKKSRKSKIA